MSVAMDIGAMTTDNDESVPLIDYEKDEPVWWGRGAAGSPGEEDEDSMSVKLGASSGSYNVRASELERHKPGVAKTSKCIVHFLDSSDAAFEIDKRAKAQVLLDRVFEHLELVEKDYFGLQFSDITATDSVRWLDPLKTLKKQIRVPPPYRLYFRVKFYVVDPSKLHEEYTRYHFFLQLKKDIVDGKFVVPHKTSVLLASYAVQSELGDFNSDDHTDGYLSEFRFVSNQNEVYEREVGELHKQHRGQTPADAEYNYLEQAKRLEMYGIDLHQARVRDQSNMEIQLGVTAVGLVVFQNNTRINTFSWAKIVKISFKRKQFFIQLRKEMQQNETPSRAPTLTQSPSQNGGTLRADTVENLIGFNMVSYRSCKNLWKSCVEHHTFFRLHSPPQAKASIFALGSKFRYSGRTEHQTMEESKRRARVERTFTRSPSKRYARRTVGATTREAIMEERSAIDGFRNTPHSHSVDNFSHARQDGYLSSPSSKTHHNLPPYNNNRNLPNSTSYPGNQLRNYGNNNGSAAPVTTASNTSNFQHNHIRATLPSDYKHNSDTLGRTATRTPVHTYSNASTQRISRPPGDIKPEYRLSRSVESRSEQRSKTLDNRSPQKRASRSVDARVNGQTEKSSDDEGGFLDHQSLRSADSTLTKSSTMTRQSDAFSPCLPSKMTYLDIDDNSVTTDRSYELNNYVTDFVPNGTVYQDGHGGLVTIRMKPDTQGRFGFNVKGGADQNMPIIVSRVAPNTPADVCIPRLNEGDQVLFINGRDVSQHKHEQVVQFIRASRETHSGELVLVVRPNVYIGEDTGDEPDFQYIPDTHHITTSLPPGGDPLAGSLLLLQEGLESGAALAQFEQLYRKKPGMTMNCARQMENTPKNRYRDISPYDQTRVKIKGPTSDYINANYVNMEIQGSGIVNRYIAAQGPLPHTSSDFWQMVWDQHSSVVVMLTTKVERGRVKCHQYWPDMYETTIFGPLQVTCLKEEKTASFAFREFTLVNPEHNNEERHIRHMQYIAWPDHGVPDDSQDFLDFVMRVRANRDGMVEPTIVHCSAGIGRTGVLITMETAMCLIEANQPVYPLDMVRHMRDQRAMLIQTSSQYKFVCEAIMRVYNEKIVVPQEDYKR